MPRPLPLNPQQRYSVPVLAFGIICVFLAGLPIGGEANSVSEHTPYLPLLKQHPEQPTETNSVAAMMHILAGSPGQYQARNPGNNSVQDSGQNAVQNPSQNRGHNQGQNGVLSLSQNSEHRPIPAPFESASMSYRVLSVNGSMSSFLGSNKIHTAQDAATDVDDPRLKREKGIWHFSDAFLSAVGSDAWAMAGVGFPNIETHGPKIAAQYKPYRAVLDWKPTETAGRDWEPVPAVYCMGLTAQQVADRAEQYERRILSYAIENGISASLVKAVVTKESCFNATAVSKVGAEGLMQLMPETARWLKVTDSTDSNQNLAAGIRYLADLRKRFGSEELALAAYNAGPGNVEKYGGIPPFEETQQYVESVMAYYQRYVTTSRFANQRVSYF